MEKKPALYPNVIPHYIPVLIEAINTGSWIQLNGRLIDPLSFVYDYGRTWLLKDVNLALKDPEQTIKEAAARDLDSAQMERLEQFKKKVSEYQARNIGALLLTAIKENRYPPELIPH